MIKTERLIIRTASDEETECFISEQTDDILKQAYTEMLDGSRAHPTERVWYALWFIERISDKAHIGELSFKGIDNGVVEMGYGICNDFRGNGYAAEAVTAIAEWAAAQSEVVRVEAETERDNTASQRVLEKAGFVPNGIFGEEGPRYVYKKSKGEQL